MATRLKYGEEETGVSCNCGQCGFKGRGHFVACVYRLESEAVEGVSG